MNKTSICTTFPKLFRNVWNHCTRKCRQYKILIMVGLASASLKSERQTTTTFHFFASSSISKELTVSLPWSRTHIRSEWTKRSTILSHMVRAIHDQLLIISRWSDLVIWGVIYHYILWQLFIWTKLLVKISRYYSGVSFATGVQVLKQTAVYGN